MDTARQKLETNDLREWCVRTGAVLNQARELLDDLNTFPVPNFNTGTNLANSWAVATRATQTLPLSLRPAEFMAAVSREVAKFTHGSVGIFLASGFAACAEAWGDAPVVRPADLLMSVDAMDRAFREVSGSDTWEFGLSRLITTVSEQLSELELLTLSQVVDTALVCAQEATIDSADAHGGVGDAGLAGACLIFASLADLAATAEGDVPTNVSTVQAMLSDWANRSRSVAESLRHTVPGGEFGATFHFEALDMPTGKLRESLRAASSEVLICKVLDGIGAGRFVAHVHTPSPLAALPYPHGAVLIHHLGRNPEAFEGDEDPLTRLTADFDNVVVLSDFAARQVPLVTPGLLVLSAAPALVETYARAGATVLLGTENSEQICWAWRSLPKGRAALIIPADPETRKMALTMRDSLDDAELSDSPVMVADTEDELSAAWLVQSLQGKQFRGRNLEQLRDLETACRDLKAGIRVEPLSHHDLDTQIRDLVNDLGPNRELHAVISSGNVSTDRMNLQLALANYADIELVAYYGGQPGSTYIGVRF
ncbi:DAK2 domain-containing protein [Mobiluncus curtisii]|uniref:DAK2 domain-containing protein n=1 Tax=Mobiluncus curtisii TaxID=2051 RepID=UPI0001E094D8|nr:DAK2 domain-containing protein [Mobiluncus curtisii]EFL94677.1 hypothetical protein HMPREF0574_0069 [Mobiluncus curtisii subsp. curtisii ATCC 35241]QQT13383.1 DAK2 domain-containing protein [Mobiluncus curtisii]STY76953.1 DAK2 domain fusion protein YloV [Mobiluncus curtisii subsp. curtisii]